MTSADLPDLARDLLALDSGERHDKTGRGLAPSDVAHLFPGGCARQLAYREQGTPATDPLPPAMVAAGLAGTAVHEVVARARTAAGWPIVEHYVTVPGLDRRGVVDGYRDGRADDLKSKSRDGLRAVVDRGKSYEGDAAQAEVYAYALETAGTLGLYPDQDGGDPWTRADPQPVDTVSVTYVSRDNLLDSFTDTWTYDRKVAQRHLMRLGALTDRVRATDPEQIERGGLDPTRRPCDGCPFRTRCWGLTDVLREDETHVSRRIAPAEVGRLAADLVRLRRERAEIEAAERHCKNALMGHSKEEFTDAEGIRRRIHWTRSKPEGGQLDQTAAKAILRELDLPIPTIGVPSTLRLPALED